MKKEEWWSKYNSYELCRDHNDKFDEWWDADRFDWLQFSICLPSRCSYFFDKWWDGDKYNWLEFSAYLPAHCSYFLISGGMVISIITVMVLIIYSLTVQNILMFGGIKKKLTMKVILVT